MRKLIASIFILFTLPVVCHSASGSVTLVNEEVTAAANSYPQNLQAYGSPNGSAGKLSAQVVWSSVTHTNATFSDGSQSTGSLTVVSTAALVAAAATDSITVPSTAAILGSPATGQITVVSTTGLAGLTANFTTVLTNYAGIALSSPSIIINAQETYTYGGNWGSTDTIAHAASTLATAINTSSVYSASVVSSTGVLISLRSSGTFANGFTVNSTSFTDISTGTFSGGANPVSITLNNGNQNLVYTYGSNWASSDTVNHAATTLATAISGVGGIIANAASAVVYASATSVGTYANAYTMATSSASRVSVSSTNFSGGLNPALQGAYFTLNGIRYRNGVHWTDASGTSTGTAASITSFFNSVSTVTSPVCGGGLGSIYATRSGGVVTLTAAVACAGGNAITLTAFPSSGGFTIGSALFTGGQSNASIVINGTTLTFGTDIPLPTVSSTTANVATAIATALNANSVLAPLITAQAVSAVVTSTADTVGASTNYTTVSSTPAALTFSNPTMTGGTNQAIALSSKNIVLTAHGFVKALPVLYSTGTVAIGGLTNQTTYFVIVVDANDIQLALTSTGAVAGVGITITSTNTQTTAHTYTLAPLAFSQGAASGKWQVSEDGVNYNDYLTTAFNVSVTSQTFAAVNPSTNTVQDFGIIDYNYIQYKTVGPTAGGVQLKVILSAKD